MQNPSLLGKRWGCWVHSGPLTCRKNGVLARLQELRDLRLGLMADIQVGGAGHAQHVPVCPVGRLVIVIDALQSHRLRSIKNIQGRTTLNA